MGKEGELSIIKEAKEKREQTLELSKAQVRLRAMLSKHGKPENLAGKDSARVNRHGIYGNVDDISFMVEIRGSIGSVDDYCALGISCGDITRSYVFQFGNSIVFDAHLDKNRQKGAWIGLPEASLRRSLAQTDIVQLNEAMDLFEQNVGRGVNRD